MCDIYLLRDKADQSMASIKRMHGERKALVKLLQRHAPQMLEAMQPEHEDHLRAGRLFAAAGKQRAASKSFAKCEKLAPDTWQRPTRRPTPCPTRPTCNACWRRLLAQGMSFTPTANLSFNPPAHRRSSLDSRALVCATGRPTSSLARSTLHRRNHTSRRAASGDFGGRASRQRTVAIGA